MRRDVMPPACSTMFGHVRAAVALLALTLAGGASAQAYVGLGCDAAEPCDQFSVRASSLQAGRRLQVNVPIPSCGTTGGSAAAAQDIKTRVTGSTVEIELEALAGMCFAAGDPLILRQATLLAGPVSAAGTYKLRYTMKDGGMKLMERELEVVVGNAAPPGPDDVARIHEFMSSFGQFFSTALEGEVLALQSGGIGGWWQVFVSRDGAELYGVWSSPAPGRVPLHRFFTDAFTAGSHFYTADEGERAAVAANPDWTYEGVVGYVMPAPAEGATCTTGKPLERYYNNGVRGAPNHRYRLAGAPTPDSGIVPPLPPAWTLEGVVACVPEAP